MQRGRRIAFDYGDIRIGVAVCDPDGIISSPLAVLATEKKNLLKGLTLAKRVEGAELSLASPLEIIANSLTSHAPPLEPDSKTGTGSS